MKKLSLIAAFIIAITGFSFAQDVKLSKTNVVIVDGLEEAVVEEDPKNYFTVKSLITEEDLVFIKIINPTKEGQSSEFIDDYIIFLFPDHDEEVEYRKFKVIDGLKFLYQHKVIESGKINIKNLNEFVERFRKKP